MQFRLRSIRLEKIHPLRVARGVHAGGDNLFLSLERDGIEGLGEMAPGTLTGCATAAEGERMLAPFLAALPPDCSPYEAWRLGRERGIAPCALAALDMALWDLLARRSGRPLYELLGLPRRAVPTSLTVGINPPEVVRERVPEILERTGARCLKIKLGSPDGIEADQASFAAAEEAARPRGVALRVDANGGWDLAGARRMLPWLRDRGVEYVEQPLHHDRLEELPALSRGRALPIFLDESCRFSTDIPAWAAQVDGVNLKLMKCGGVTEALRIVATARAFGLRTMIGCMGESSVAISAGASLAALFDFIDLDSHLNLREDPADGPVLAGGIVLPAERPGHGARWRVRARGEAGPDGVGEDGEFGGGGRGGECGQRKGGSC